jgi:hypothetical protein
VSCGDRSYDDEEIPMSSPLPIVLSEITGPWLTEALGQANPGTVVRSIEIEAPLWGTATKAFLNVSTTRVLRTDRPSVCA